MKEKHYIYQQGGLGNQLYILAYATYLKEKGIKNIRMYAPNKERKDTKNKSKRNVYQEITHLLGLPMSNLNYFFFSLAKKMAKKKFLSKYVVYEEENEFEWAVFKEPNSTFLPKVYLHSGYYQSYLYQTPTFLEKVYQIIKDLVGNTQEFFISENDAVLHIRRGDFLKAKNTEKFSIIETPFYLEGLQMISEKIAINKVYILSDDFEVIEDIILTISNKYEVVLVKGNTVLQDLYLLTQFKNYIIGNSTFSWWGAYLSKYKEKLNVIVPKEPWKIAMPDKTPYPPYWIQL